MVDRLTLHGMLEILSYCGLLIAISFGIMGLYSVAAQLTTFSQGFAATATLLSLISAGLYRLGTGTVSSI